MNRILAIQVKQIGDVLLTLPALRVLRRHYPDAHITFAVTAPAAGLAPLFACVDEVVGVGQGWTEPGMWRHIGGPCFDLALDFSGTDRALFLSILSGAPVRAGFSKHEDGFFRSRIYTRSSDVLLRDHHTIDYFIKLLPTLGIEPVEEPLTATLPSREAGTPPPQLLKALRTDNGNPGNEATGHKPYAVIHPGTARAEKYWIAERWAEVIRHLAAQGFTPVITGASGQEETEHVGRIQAALREEIPLVDLVGQLSLLGSAQVISRCDLFLGVDTAAMHLASAFQRPLVALFGPTSPFRWRPRNPEAKVIVSGQGTPATRYKKDDEAGDMAEITSATVLEAIDSLLRDTARLPSLLPL